MSTDRRYVTAGRKEELVKPKARSAPLLGNGMGMGGVAVKVGSSHSMPSIA